MQNFGLKDVLYIIGIIVSSVVTFLSSRYKMKEYIRDKNDDLTAKWNDLKLEMKDLKGKDDLQ